jgi:hypothetical protein
MRRGKGFANGFIHEAKPDHDPISLAIRTDMLGEPPEQ